MGESDSCLIGIVCPNQVKGGSFNGLHGGRLGNGWDA